MGGCGHSAALTARATDEISAQIATVQRSHNIQQAVEEFLASIRRG